MVRRVDEVGGFRVQGFWGLSRFRTAGCLRAKR